MVEFAVTLPITTPRLAESLDISDELRANLRRKGFQGSFITPLPEPAILTGSRRRRIAT